MVQFSIFYFPSQTGPNSILKGKTTSHIQSTCAGYTPNFMLIGPFYRWNYAYSLVTYMMLAACDMLNQKLGSKKLIANLSMES